MNRAEGNVATFKDLVFKPQGHGLGMQAHAEFPNGYGASVVRGPYTYGGKEGKYEMAVLGPDGALCYDTPVTDDVMGWLEPEDVTAKLAEIAALPAKAEIQTNSSESK